MKWEEFVRWSLEALVRIPSSAESGTDAILLAAVDRLKYLGLEPVVHEDVKAVSATTGEGGVLFNGHLDTVPVASGWTREQASWDGDFLYGRGTSDMKAGCAAAFAAAAALSERNVPCSLLFTTDEETTMAAPQKLAATDLVTGAAAVIVGEPTALRVIHQEKGVLWYRGTTRGRSAHGSLPHTGDSAIHRMAHGLGRLEAYARPKDVLAEITVNAGRIQGGVAPNVVPDACWADLDCRHPPGTTKADVEAAVRDAFRASGSEVELSLMHEVPPALVPPDAPHLRVLKGLAGTDLGGVTYGTEMAWYAAHNPRCAVFGPGDPQRIHVPDERVSLSETIRAAQILTEFGSRMAGRT